MVGGVEVVLQVLVQSVLVRTLLPLGIQRSATYQGNDDLAVGRRLEVIRLLQVLPDLSVVVDLAVGGEDDGLIGVGQGLGARLCLLCERAPGLAFEEQDLPTPTILRRSWQRTARNVSPSPQCDAPRRQQTYLCCER